VFKETGWEDVDNIVPTRDRWWALVNTKIQPPISQNVRKESVLFYKLIYRGNKSGYFFSSSTHFKSPRLVIDAGGVGE
jgi:hypothetical protein